MDVEIPCEATEEGEAVERRRVRVLTGLDYSSTATDKRYRLGSRLLPSGWGDTRTTRHGAALLTCWAVPPSTMSSNPRLL
jgi:hypothetical protein